MNVMRHNPPKQRQTTLRLTGKQAEGLRQHLYPGDGCEAPALALCGRRHDATHDVLCIHEIMPIPYDECLVRTPNRVSWPTDRLPALLRRAEDEGLGLVKIHSHPSGWDAFSAYDDASDRDVLGAAYSWLDDNAPHASVIMLPDGRMIGRVMRPDGAFIPIDLIAVAGDDLLFYHARSGEEEQAVPDHALRHAQAFGAGTIRRLARLSVGVIGCSGTGSPVVEMLGRLGVGELVLVDPQRVERLNLNRILNTGQEDTGHYKVEVLADAVTRMGTGTRVVAISDTLTQPDVIKRVALCDIVFGCMDSIEGRDVLNRLAAHYLIPYFDIGVGLVADGRGGVGEVNGAVHYLQPDGSSLLSRGVYSAEQVAAEAMRRLDPEAYKHLRQEKYIQGVEEDTPAVVSVNVQLAALTINEFLARLHPYRLDPNACFAWHQVSLSAGLYQHGSEGNPCVALAQVVGRGDAHPLLGLPYLSQKAEVLA